MTDSWTDFSCENPDFVVCSIPDNAEFRVQRSCLERGSEVFRDMFWYCDTDVSRNNDGSKEQILELDESAGVLAALLRLLHFPPSPCVYDMKPKKSNGMIVGIRADFAIPLPLLYVLLGLADKYAFSESLVQSLHSHLVAHVSTFPLQVYAYATTHDLDHIAAQASKYLLHPPLSTYTPEEISIIPSSKALHKLFLLHSLRVKRLRELLLGEDIFPHGYGECPTHGLQTRLLWNQQKTNLILEIEAATDVAAEMATVSGSLQNCGICHKACTAALDMLAYKCRKVLRRIDQLP